MSSVPSLTVAGVQIDTQARDTNTPHEIAAFVASQQPDTNVEALAETIRAQLGLSSVDTFVGESTVAGANVDSVPRLSPSAPAPRGRGTWLYVTGNVDNLDTRELARLRSEVSASAEKHGAQIEFVSLTSIEQLNAKLEQPGISRMYFAGHGVGGAITATDGTLINATDVEAAPALRDMSFHTVACELGVQARDWDLTFGNVYGGGPLANLLGPSTTLLDQPRVYSDAHTFEHVERELSPVHVQIASALVGLKRGEWASPLGSLEEALPRLDAFIAEVETTLQSAPTPADHADGGASFGQGRKLLGRMTAIRRSAVEGLEQARAAARDAAGS